jgi:hypothetical protein
VITLGLAGVIRQARHCARGLAVSLEVIAGPLGGDAEFRRRLAAETATAALLEHPSIVSVYEVIASGDAAGVVSERFSGGNLSELPGTTPLDLPAACIVADSVLLALLVAHRAGVLHGDVRSEAVIVGRDRVRLAGFGIARALRPELPPDAATDTYALTQLTVALLSGSGNAMAGLPRQLRKVLERGASRRVDHRYRTASGMRAALSAAAHHDIGPDWREVAAGELRALFAGVPPIQADAPPAAPRVLHEPPAAPPPPPPEHRREATPRAPAAKRDRGLPVREREPKRAAAISPVIKVVPAASGLRRRRQRIRVVTGFALVAAAVVVGLAGGIVVSAVRGGDGSTADALTVGRPVSVQIQPAAGTCNTVFAATARGPVHGQGTLVYRWERSDGLRTESTRLAVSPGDSSFLVTEHWQLSGQVAHPAITFDLINPVAMTVTVPIPYSCP